MPETARTDVVTGAFGYSGAAIARELLVANSRVLFEAAGRAGVRRIVHVSITHADRASPYPYFRGKAEVERALQATGIPYAIVRPAILFGVDGVLLNNIAWLLRRLPVFANGQRPGRLRRPGDRRGQAHRLDRGERRHPRAPVRERDRPPLQVGLRNGTLKTCHGYPHGIPTTHADTINADLLNGLPRARAI
jgi:NAD(P)H-binding